MSMPEKFPFTVKSGSVSVRIREAQFKSKGKTYDGYQIEWYEGQKRHRPIIRHKLILMTPIIIWA